MPEQTQEQIKLAKVLAQAVIDSEHCVHDENDRHRLEKEFAALPSDILERLLKRYLPGDATR